MNLKNYETRIKTDVTEFLFYIKTKPGFWFWSHFKGKKQKERRGRRFQTHWEVMTMEDRSGLHPVNLVLLSWREKRQTDHRSSLAMLLEANKAAGQPQSYHQLDLCHTPGNSHHLHRHHHPGPSGQLATKRWREGEKVCRRSNNTIVCFHPRG